MKLKVYYKESEKQGEERKKREETVVLSIYRAKMKTLETRIIVNNLIISRMLISHVAFL